MPYPDEKPVAMDVGFDNYISEFGLVSRNSASGVCDVQWVSRIDVNRPFYELSKKGFSLFWGFNENMGPGFLGEINKKRHYTGLETNFLAH